MAEQSTPLILEEVAQRLSQGHSFRYHVLGEDRVALDGSTSPNSNQFNHPSLKYGDQLGIYEQDAFYKHALGTLTSPDTVGYRRSDGGAVFFNQVTNTQIFYDPNNPDLGTILRSERGVEDFIKGYDKDVREGFRANPDPQAAFVRGGWQAVMAVEFTASIENSLDQSVGDRRTAARNALQDLGVQTYTPEGHALRKPLLGAVDIHASRGLNAGSLAVNVAEGDVVGASVDAASMVADSNGVQKAVVTATTKALGAELVEAGLKKIPVVGAVVTVGTVLYASGAQAMDGNYKLAAGELAAGIPEAAGNIFGFGLGDAAREAARQGLIVAGGDEFAAVEKSGLRQLGEGAYALGEQAYGSMTVPQGKPLEAVLPADYRSMTLGSDAMGDRSEVSRIAIERSGFAANDPRNNLTVLSSDIAAPRAHLLILPDGSVQGPESGGVAFGNNPSIAAGVNGGTLGIMYAGTGAMNDAQYSTLQSTTAWLTAQRGRDGLTSPVEVIAGSLNTAQILQIPTPQGFTPGVAPEAGAAGPSMPVQQRKLSNGTSGP